MRQHLKDHWYIAIALVAIFVAGNGFGYVFGSKRSAWKQVSTTVASSSWVDATLESLSESLDLSEDQINAIRPQVEATAAKVVAARERTLLDYHVLLLALHDDLGNSLDSAQQKRLEKSKASLEETIRTRFSTLLEDQDG